MIAVFRVRFTPTPGSALWSDTAINAWLDPGEPYSLANFWQHSSFGQADLSYHLFPPLVMDDPRLSLPHEVQHEPDPRRRRRHLVRAVTKLATEQFSPNWEDFDQALIWFAQRTDLFGGPGYPVDIGYIAGGGGLLDFVLGEDKPNKLLSVAISDIASSFDTACHELGHAFGFHHSKNLNGEDYGDPYDIMSAATYGPISPSPQIDRPANPALPSGLTVDGQDVNALIGPFLSPANLYESPLKKFLSDAGIFKVLPDHQASPASVTLSALDRAMGVWPAVEGPAAIVIPPIKSTGHVYFVELRRRRAYDAGITGPALVVHRYHRKASAIVYVAALLLDRQNGDRDFIVATDDASFTIRVNSVDANFASASLTIGGPDFARKTGASIAVSDEVGPITRGQWVKTTVSPCFLFPPDEYAYRQVFRKHTIRLEASAVGFTSPVFRWSIAGQQMMGSGTTRPEVEVRHPQPRGAPRREMKSVPVVYTVSNNVMTLTCEPFDRAFAALGFTSTGNFELEVELSVHEADHSGLVNAPRSSAVKVYFDNCSLQWDRAYAARQQQCKSAARAVERKRIPKRVGPKGPLDFGPVLGFLKGAINKDPKAVDGFLDALGTGSRAEKRALLRRINRLPTR